MRTAFGLVTSLSLVLLAPACPGGGGGDTDNASTGGPTGGPTGDPTGATDPATSDVPTSQGPGDPSDPTTSTTSNPSDPTADTSASDPTASTTDPTGVDPGELIEPGDPGPGDVTFTIRADTDVCLQPADEAGIDLQVIETEGGIL